MLDALDLSLKMKKSEYREVMPGLRTELRDIQRPLRATGTPVVVLFEGWDASGKGDSIGHLVHPLDPRGFKVHTTRRSNEEEMFRPFLWRFATRLPEHGHIAFFDRSWYWRLLDDRLEGDVRRADVAAVAAEIRDFERQLADDGAVIVKFWLQITRKEQDRRLKTLKKDRFERWRATGRHRGKRPGYRKYMGLAQEMIEQTSTSYAPWTIVESIDPYYRRVKLFRTVLSAVRRRLPESMPPPKPEKIPKEVRSRGRAVKIKPVDSILSRVDLSRSLTRKEYETKLDRLQKRLRELQFEAYRQRVPVVLAYEGWDAAGKGGNIKRLTQELDPRGYDVIPVAAPNATEKRHHYLWRFWNALPKAGHFAIFDRTWYGRVLVERVEGFATGDEWSRAYEEINLFERHMTDYGAVVVKFWLQISPEEQLRRFEERARTPHKVHKITADDWRNRLKWNDYRTAVVDMIEKTDTSNAPWTIVEAENKLWARIRALTVTTRAIEKRLKA